MITYNDLTEGQQAAVDRVIEAVDNKTNALKRFVTVCGPAGTGKTTLTKVLLEKLVEKGVDGVILTAPTHAAKKVLSKLAGRKADTLHTVLRINPNNYEDRQVFEQVEIPDLSKARVLLVDEASMVDQKLFDIAMSSIPSFCAVIGIGDKCQIRPVDPSGTGLISPFFTDQRFDQVELTEIKRYSSDVESETPILDVATDIRNGKWIYGKEDSNGEGVIHCPEVATFMRHYFSVVKTPDDLFDNRVCAYTNKTVDKLNEIIRKRIYGTTDSFIKDEVVVMQEPLVKSVKYDGKWFTEVIFNNGQYVKVLQVIPNKIVNVTNRGVGDSVDINCYGIQVQTNDPEDVMQTSWLNIIVDEAEKRKFFFYQGKTAETYKGDQRYRKFWKDYWQSKALFHEVKPLPACSIHKTQGSTVENVFIFTSCIHKAPYDQAIELLYVGATRAKKNVFFV